MRATDLAGLSGAVLIAVLYGLNLRGLVDSRGWRFPAGNLAGSLLIMLSLSAAFNLPSLLIELFWSTISLVGVVGAMLRRRAA